MSYSSFVSRHIGSSSDEQQQMLAFLGYDTFEAFVDDCIPKDLQDSTMDFPAFSSESSFIKHMTDLMAKNKEFRSFIGQGYYPTHTPLVIQRNVFENPAWYTAYTPYQAEISQGRLSCLFNFQTMIAKLTGMEFANASLLDEGTAVAEAMLMLKRLDKRSRTRFSVYGSCFTQTLSVLKTRAEALDISVDLCEEFSDIKEDSFGLLIQYPDARGNVFALKELVDYCHKRDILIVVASDLMALQLYQPPGDFEVDAVVGSSQRFGVPMGYGGPHAAFFATKNEYKRQVPGRIVGLSKDSSGKPSYRLALVTREQHIRRDRATSNICTAQALLANMALFYAVWHGVEGLRAMSRQIFDFTAILAASLDLYKGIERVNSSFYDTLSYRCHTMEILASIRTVALDKKVNFFYDDASLELRFSLDELTGPDDLVLINNIFAEALSSDVAELNYDVSGTILSGLERSSLVLPELFLKPKSETWMMRWLNRLVSQDYSLVDGMIPLGSCTMKCNAAVYMQPLSWAGFNGVHPFVPLDQVKGYHDIFSELEKVLMQITGMDAVSLQPNAGSSGEYAGLLAIKSFLKSQGQGHRDIALIPESAHGTNPASARLCGFSEVKIKQLANGYIDVDDLAAKLDSYKDRVAVFMITYPSTYGVFEETIKDVCDRVHSVGAQVYLDGANMNAQVGLLKPGLLGFDVMHLNLHKTFAIPHGGGGPGVGPIAVKSHLIPFLPVKDIHSLPLISAAPSGSALILLISYAYIFLMGDAGLLRCSQVALLHANYIAASLEKIGYVLPYKNNKKRCAHELIVSLKDLKKEGVFDSDIAKRLMDYGFHAPTMSWPVVSSLMIEPTESEDKAELDRFISAMKHIYDEIDDFLQCTDRSQHFLKFAPFVRDELMSEDWAYSFSRQAALPLNNAKATVKRLDDSYGDKHFCACS
ncbi:MAG: aminomethyl-transferring glycine dehydrogenase [bacterium]